MYWQNDAGYKFMLLYCMPPPYLYRCAMLRSIIRENFGNFRQLLFPPENIERAPLKKSLCVKSIKKNLDNETIIKCCCFFTWQWTKKIQYVWPRSSLINTVVDILTLSINSLHFMHVLVTVMVHWLWHARIRRWRHHIETMHRWHVTGCERSRSHVTGCDVTVTIATSCER